MIEGLIIGLYGALMYYFGYKMGFDQGLKAVVAKALKGRR